MLYIKIIHFFSVLQILVICVITELYFIHVDNHYLKGFVTETQETVISCSKTIPTSGCIGNTKGFFLTSYESPRLSSSPFV